VRSEAASVREYLGSLPLERRKELAAVRTAIKRHLPKGYAETMQYGMITYVVPLATFPEGYLGKKEVPLPFVSLAAQKTHLALYLMNVYGSAELERWFRAEYAKTGKRLDMGKSCIRFDASSELALDVIGAAIARTPVGAYVEEYLATRKKSPRPRKKGLSRTYEPAV